VAVTEDAGSGVGVGDLLGDTVIDDNLVAVDVGFDKPKDNEISVIIIRILRKLELTGFCIENHSRYIN